MERTIIKYIPPDIIFKILIRLPVKSLLQSRLVSKLWNDIIRSKPFIKSHVDHQKISSLTNRFLLTQYADGYAASLVEGESFEVLESLAYKVFDIMGERTSTDYELIFRGICDGLVCLSGNDSYYLFNPILKKVQIVPSGGNQFDEVSGWLATSVCFGYHADDYKVIEIHNDWPIYYFCIYSLNTDSWSLRKFVTTRNDITLDFKDGGSLLVNGVVYFVRYGTKGAVVCVDLRRGIVTEVELPYNFKVSTEYIMEEFGESIALIEYTSHDDRQSECDLSMWVLKLSDASVLCHTKKFEAGINYRCNPIGLVDYNKVVVMMTDRTVQRYSRKFFLHDVETEYQHRFRAFEGKPEEHREGPCPGRINNFVESLVLLTIPAPYVLRRTVSHPALSYFEKPT